MKISIEIDTQEYETTGARDEEVQLIRQLCDLLEGEQIVGALRDTERQPPPPKKPEPGLDPKKIVALQADITDKAKLLADASRPVFKSFTESLKERYGTTVIPQLPPSDLTSILAEVEGLLDAEV